MVNITNPDEVITEAFLREVDLSAFGFAGTLALITLDNGIVAKVGDLGLMDSMSGTYVWDHMEEACP